MLLPFLLLGAVVDVLHAAQTPVATTGLTLVDALSADADYSLLLRLLQRTRLIPTLNRLNGSALFAPTNDAIKSHSVWAVFAADDPPGLVHDNIQEQLRQQLFYHLINYSLPSPPDNQDPLVLKTMLYPRKPLDAPSDDPPPYPPWFPTPNGTLGSEPQRLRVATRKDKAYVGVDASGDNGVEITKGRVDAGNGILMGISAVLDPPESLASVIAQHSPVSYFDHLRTPAITEFLNNTKELTLFLPVNDAWNVLDPVERLYLESEFATDDLYRILSFHAVAKNGVTWSDAFAPALNLTTLDGSNLEIVVSPEKTMISSATLEEPDIYASNGVLHLVSSLLVPEGALKLTPEKYLLALNSSTFVSLLHSANLTNLVNNTEAQYTILAPNNDVLELYNIGRLVNSGEVDDLPERGSQELRELLSYHFIPGKWTPDKLKDGMLLQTALEQRGLNGKAQVLPIEIKQDSSMKDREKELDKSVRFGGVGTIGDHVEIGNTVVYFVSRPLDPPIDPLQAALPHLHLSSFLAAVFSTSLADVFKTKPETTILIPDNNAFGKRLGGLVTSHLLSSSGKSDLEKVLLHHVIDGVHYANTMKKGGRHTYPTLEGSDIQVSKSQDAQNPKNYTFVVTPSGGWSGLSSELDLTNLITQTGVIHEISDILLPRSVELTLGKLVRSAKGDTMARMMVASGFDWILNGTAPPEGSEWEKQGLKDASFTILCPDDDAFPEPVLAELFNDTQRLREIVEQHLVPAIPSQENLVPDQVNNNRPLSLDRSPTYSTLRSPESAYGDVVFTTQDGERSSYIVGIKGARGTDGREDWARVLSWGRSSFPSQAFSGGGVIKLDRPLSPYYPPWWIEYGLPVVVGVLGGLGILAFYYGVYRFWNREPEATYGPIDGDFENDGDA